MRGVVADQPLRELHNVVRPRQRYLFLAVALYGHARGAVEHFQPPHLFPLFGLSCDSRRDPASVRD
jgi:hypothetical protein